MSNAHDCIKKTPPPGFGSVYLLAPLARLPNSLYPLCIVFGLETVFILQFLG